jgi:hypothetical protein
MNIIKGVKCLYRSRHFLKEQPSKYLKVRSRQETDVLIRSGNRTRWQRLKATLFPHLKRSKELAYAYTEAKVEKERSEARKIAEEANEIATKREIIKQRSAKEFGNVIDDIFKDDCLPLGAKALKLAKLMEENPQVLAHLEKAEKVIDKFSLNNNLENKLVDESQSCIIGNSNAQSE